ncbi:hypothetical protein SAMN05421821_105164 [Mucilaginibacter lappiensis]|uniref:Uncharacterized protein n=1 Tax=Mucilaginibacter lappiensis TaxID=354630 RepID=A0ABR6PJD5_9SPHI|nr:hypothetical protein [Mucilaginibacter lappiensis]MBB6109746.1 hypothetical protein [Mucilaginibacter lappiensis]SIR14022.1 hypothetical protein SAMN05421821_105164 [Mucilaginibacter lappiensis]
MAEPRNPEELNLQGDSTANEPIEEEISYIDNLRRNAEADQIRAAAKERLKGQRQDRRERKKYADSVFTLVAIWLMFVLLIFMWYGMGKLQYSDNVIIALLTTSTANVIFIFNFVMKYLFKSQD